MAIHPHRRPAGLLSVLTALAIAGGLWASPAGSAQDACSANYEPPSAECRPQASAAVQTGAGCDRQPINLGQLKTQLKNYFRCSYRTDLATVLADARAYVEQGAGEVAQPAIVLDIDETSLSNWSELWQDDFGYFRGGPCEMKPQTPCGWRAWQLTAQASAIEPTLGLFNAARSKKVAIFFITGREEDAELRAATTDNLLKVGYFGWSELIMRASPACRNNDTTGYKRCERKALAAKGYTIIANIGDQWSDLDPDPVDKSKGSYAERIFKVPNPFYFIP